MAMRSSRQGFRSDPGTSAHREIKRDEFGFQTQREKFPGKLNVASAVSGINRTIIKRLNGEGKPESGLSAYWLASEFFEYKGFRARSMRRYRGRNLAHRLPGECTGGNWKHGPQVLRQLTIAGRLGGATWRGNKAAMCCGRNDVSGQRQDGQTRRV